MDIIDHANALEPGFPGFDAEYPTFQFWALKGVVRNMAAVVEAPTQGEWDQLRKILSQIINNIDGTEEGMK